MPAPIPSLYATATVLAGALALAACSHGGADPYPSLAQRPAERVFAAPAPAAPAAPGPADPALLARLSTIEAAATTANAEFERAAQAARDAVAQARGMAEGSEAWAGATVTLAALDSARSATAQALADCDSLMAAHALTAAASASAREQAGYAAIVSSDSRVAALVAHEDATIAALHASGG